MFIRKCKYEIEKLKEKQRIEFLENIICPSESHKYKKIDYHFQDATGITIYHYVCENCGKRIQSYKILN